MKTDEIEIGHDVTSIAIVIVVVVCSVVIAFAVAYGFHRESLCHASRCEHGSPVEIDGECVCIELPKR